MNQFINEALECFMVFCQMAGVTFFTFATCWLLDEQFTTFMIKFMWAVACKLLCVGVI